MFNKYYVERIKYETAVNYLENKGDSCRCGAVCYGLYKDGNDGLFGIDGKLVGVIVLSSTWNISTRNSVFGEDYSKWVMEVHRFSYDELPKTVVKKFLKTAINKFNEEVVGIHAILFSVGKDSQVNGIVKSAGFKFCQTTSSYTIKIDFNGSSEVGFVGEKNRYVILMAHSKREKERIKKMCRLFD